MKEQKLLSHLRKCIREYGLIEDGDRILVGVSGGKDSLTLLYALKKLQAFCPESFTLQAVSVDTGLSMDFSGVRSFCEALKVPYSIEKTEISKIVFEEKKEDNPCSLCANMRRGALVNAAVKLNCNKLALGHNKDDYLTTLLLSLIYEGRFYTFAPLTAYPDREIKIIRPLLYVAEASVRDFADENSFPVLKNLCPADHITKRSEMAELLRKLQKKYPDIRERLLHSVTSSQIPDWEALRKE